MCDQSPHTAFWQTIPHSFSGTSSLPCRSSSAEHLPPPNEALSLNPQTPLPGDLGLDPNLWRLIFSRLPIDNLPAAAAVCRVWRGVIADREVWVSCFVNRWKLGRLHGAPASRGFWIGGLSQFVVAHWLQPEDSVVSVAIKFGVEVRKYC